MNSQTRSMKAILWTVTAFLLAVIMMSAVVQADDKDDKKKEEKKKAEQKAAPAAPQAKPPAQVKPPSPPPQQAKPPIAAKPPATTQPGGPKPGAVTTPPPATTQPGGPKPGAVTTPTPGTTHPGGPKPGALTTPPPPGATQPGGPKPGAVTTPPPLGTKQPRGPKPGTVTTQPPGTTQPGGPKPGAVTTQQQPTPTSQSRPPKPFVPPPNTKVTKAPTGNTTYAHADGRKWEVGAKGQVTHFSKPGVDARFHENGRVSQAQFTRPDRSQMIVSNTVHGERRIEVVRPDHTRLVNLGPHHGFVERPVANRTGYISRTYVEEGRSYAYVYRSYSYRNVVYYRYVPPVQYRPAFYSWAERPWRAPVRYDWGWRRDPWYGQYESYFTPAPVYPTASLWLTDFLLASNLRRAYDSQPMDYAAPSAPAGMYAISPEVKQAIAEEVRRELASERTVAGQPGSASRFTGGGGEVVPPALDPNQRIFVASMNLNVFSGGQECALTAGDIVLRAGDNLVEGTKVPVTILSSKANDCAPNSNALLEVADLQEMHNNFRQQIGVGLSTLASNKGAGGLPEAPTAAPRQFDEGQAAVDPGVAAELERQQQDAARAEAEFERAAAVGGQN